MLPGRRVAGSWCESGLNPDYAGFCNVPDSTRTPDYFTRERDSQSGRGRFSHTRRPPTHSRFINTGASRVVEGRVVTQEVTCRYGEYDTRVLSLRAADKSTDGDNRAMQEHDSSRTPSYDPSPLFLRQHLTSSITLPPPPTLFRDMKYLPDANP